MTVPVPVTVTVPVTVAVPVTVTVTVPVTVTITVTVTVAVPVTVTVTVPVTVPVPVPVAVPVARGALHRRRAFTRSFSLVGVAHPASARRTAPALESAVTVLAPVAGVGRDPNQGERSWPGSSTNSRSTW